LEDLHAATESQYRLSVRAQDSGLDQAQLARRYRLEVWLNEQLRAQGDVKIRRTSADFRQEAEKKAAYTWLNRLVFLRLMEAANLSTPKALQGGWESQGYKDFRSLAPALVRGDETEGYRFLLEMIFQDLAVDMPGLYGRAGIADLIPMPASTLRQVVEALDDPVLSSCWNDDMTLGWVYQFWNDPEREILDEKLNAGEKLEPYEIASKTQIFTERYIVDWLLQNSLGPIWLSICKQNGWIPEVQADGTLQRLEQRRLEWRQKRERGEVPLTELMPLLTDAERRWALYIPQPLPDNATAPVAKSVRDLKILDPAVGSGHFLIVAFDLLFALYQEEARHRREENQDYWSAQSIVESILEKNLHGIDIDSRAVQITAASLWLKAQQTCKDAHPEHLNVVASNLRLSSLPDDDPALIELRREVERETGIPAALTNKIVHALHGADHLGSLLKIDAAVDEAISKCEVEFGRMEPLQGNLFSGFPDKQDRVAISKIEAKTTMLERIESFLDKHSSGDDLGLRLRGEQLAVGVRFIRLIKENTYDLVVANPPYQGTSKITETKYINDHYRIEKECVADLYAAFLLRGLQFVHGGGTSAMLTMRNWMFLNDFEALRCSLIQEFDLRALGDFDRGAFEEIQGEVVSVVASVFRKSPRTEIQSIALQPTRLDDRTRGALRTQQKRAATLCQVGLHQFNLSDLTVVPEWPLVYWWSQDLLNRYSLAPKLRDTCEVRTGMSTSNNARFIRYVWEISSSLDTLQMLDGPDLSSLRWPATVMGAKGLRWIDQPKHVVSWRFNGLEMKVLQERKYGSVSRRIQSQDMYFRVGVAFSCIGNDFSARVHRFPSIFGQAGSSVFPDDVAAYVCLLNKSESKAFMESFNPTVNFQVGDVERVPMFGVSDSQEIFGLLQREFASHESHRETSVEFKCPGPSAWRYAQEWAQKAVDRCIGETLPPYISHSEAAQPTDHVSFAFGVVLGRFSPTGEGIIDPAKSDLTQSLVAGILFLDGTLEPNDRLDSLGSSAADPLLETWAQHGGTIDARSDLRTWLRLKLFTIHNDIYENRPIYWPLSSNQKTFVAWINVHRFNSSTLRVLLADHLYPALTRIDGQLQDLKGAAVGTDKTRVRDSEKRYDKLLVARDELRNFIANVEQCAERGAPPTNAKCPIREVDARYELNLDDGIMINSAALWPLLDPQWRSTGGSPKTWWQELSQPKKEDNDFDWSHLSMLYWPTRVNEKCQLDPSLAVAHGCFWKYHPEHAWTWELRLQDEIGTDFQITESSYRGDSGDSAHRIAYLQNNATEALTAVEKEIRRRRGRGKAAKRINELRLLVSGLWSALPTECWALEDQVIKTQHAAFRLHAPDEEEARALFELSHPEHAEARRRLLASFESTGKLFSEAAL
jgi:hypothetical protein